jgi:phospholipid-binding lipoprotein MlaA
MNHASFRVRTARGALLLLGLAALGGCAALPSGKPDPRDQFERVNRSVYRFNVTMDKAIVRPVAVQYRKLVPAAVRTGLSNFFVNLGTPDVIVNELLQARFQDSVHDTIRLAVNTVFGLGFFDPASKAGLIRHQQDFGLTLAHWGVKPGPYLMLPVLGPSTLRDTVGMVPDEYAAPRHYLKWYDDYSLYLLEYLGIRTDLLDSDSVLDTTYDPYAFVRNAYLQHRDYQAHGDQSKDIDVLPEMLDDPAAAPPPAAPGGAAPPADATMPAPDTTAKP